MMNSEEEERYSHYYLDYDSYPLTRCPHCSSDLTSDNGLEIDLRTGKSVYEKRTRLDSLGKLMDTPEGDISKGFHAGTECAKCGAFLDEYERG